MQVRRNSTSLLHSAAPYLVALAVGLALVALLAPWASDAAFPGQNGKIAYDTFDGNDTEIATINPDGTGNTVLTSNTDRDFEPAWSPNGQRIVFSRVIVGATVESEVWVMNADGSGQAKVATASSGNVLDPGPSPAFTGDGTRVVYIGRGPGSNQEVFIANADGSGTPTNLTNTADYEFEPTVSADSQLIAFDREVSVPGNNVNVVYSMQADGMNQTPLTPTDGSVSAEGPNFSPDGTRLTFAYCDTPTEGCFPHDIVTMSSTGGPVTQVTSIDPMDNLEDFDPVFSPDGMRIAFQRFDYNSQAADILTVAASGGATQPVTTAGSEFNPDWQPVFTPPPPDGGTGGTAAALKRAKKCRGVRVTILTTNGNDVIKGTPGRDVVHGQRGRDRIYGFKGNDRLCGGRGKDHIFGGAGNDVIFGGHHADFIFGNAGRDRLFGGTPGAPIQLLPDHCFGGSGRDGYRNCQRRKGIEGKFRPFP